MPQKIATAAAAFVLGFAAVSASRAAEMTPGASIGAAAVAESESSARDEAAPSGPRAVGAGDSARKHLHPDSANEARDASGRSNLAADGSSSADVAPKAHHRGGAWQALLPGVMK